MANKKRLIDANALVGRIKERLKNDMIVKWLCGIVEDAPTVDAVEVVHGRWDKNWRGDNIVYCNQCYIPQDIPTPYCASCGAKMDEERG